MVSQLTLHPQVLSSRGIPVDESIAEALEALWSAGFETLFSCGGDGEKLSRGRRRPLDGYIAFLDPSPSQEQRIRAAAEAIGRHPEHWARAEHQATVIRFPASQRETVLRELLRDPSVAVS